MSVPVVVDGESAFGGVLKVMRTVRTFEGAGVAGYLIEDQTQDRAAVTSPARRSSRSRTW